MARAISSISEESCSPFATVVRNSWSMPDLIMIRADSAVFSKEAPGQLKGEYFAEEVFTSTAK